MNSDVNGEIAVMCAAEMGHGDDVKYLHQADFDIKVGGILGPGSWRMAQEKSPAI